MSIFFGRAQELLDGFLHAGAGEQLVRHLEHDPGGCIGDNEGDNGGRQLCQRKGREKMCDLRRIHRGHDDTAPFLRPRHGAKNRAAPGLVAAGLYHSGWVEASGDKILKKVAALTAFDKHCHCKTANERVC